MKLKLTLLFGSLMPIFYACEPERLNPSVDCTASDLSVTITEVVNSSCTENDGSITVQGAGGEGPYVFAINEEEFREGAVFHSLATGSYTITIKDANACTSTVQGSVGNSAGFTIETSATPTNCNANDGQVTVSPVGGEAPYQYKIGNGAFGDSPVMEGLAEGSYTITAKDANNCEATAEVTISNATSLDLSINTQDAGCGSSNGSIAVTIDGGTAPYQFKLGNNSFVSNNTFSNLSAGSYTITARDANGCEETESQQVFSGVKYSTTIKNIIATNCASSSCHGGNQSPNLSSLANIQANAQAIKNATANKSMPKNGSLSQTQIDAIACWVNDGAPNN